MEDLIDDTSDLKMKIENRSDHELGSVTWSRLPETEPSHAEVIFPHLQEVTLFLLVPLHVATKKHKINDRDKESSYGSTAKSSEVMPGRI
jgi:hypothetical protein